MEKQKRPIYLWILLILSGIISVLGVIGLFNRSGFNEEQIRQVYGQANLPAETVNQMVDYLKHLTAANSSPAVAVLAVLDFLLVVLALYFFFKREIAKSNYSYLAYLILKLIGILYSYVTLTGLANRYLQDAQARSLMMLGSQVSSIVLFIVYVILIVLVVYKVWRQNRAIEEE